MGMQAACANTREGFKTSYMCVWIVVDYRTFFGWWPRRAVSDVFAWNGKQWRKGLIAADKSAEDICGTVSDFPQD